MKQYFLFSIITLLSIFGCTTEKEKLEESITKQLDLSVKQYVLMAESLKDMPDRLPRTFENDQLQTVSSGGWVSGFFPGSLWYLYEYTQDPILKEYAEKYTECLKKEQYNKGTHDLGFMLYCSYGNGFRLTGSEEYQKVLLTGAESLSTRYNETVGCIQSWGTNEKWQFPVIIDNMMNLEFLFWTARISGNSCYKDLSISHADKTIENHFRPDYSSYHVISYDTVTGRVEKKNTHQGYMDESAWSRGQAWALYGYVMTYREAQEKHFLQQANHIAGFILEHPNLPEDKIPYWDFNAPDIPNAKRDASAGAIIASALIELSQYVDGDLSRKYLNAAWQQIQSLSSPEYFAEIGTNGHFILKHSVGHMPNGSEIDVPLSYADYYYIEALLRMKQLLAENKLTM